jgi:hypothetical protein
MPGLPRKASSEPLRHVTLKKHSGPRTSLLGPFLLALLLSSPVGRWGREALVAPWRVAGRGFLFAEHRECEKVSPLS